MSGISSGAVRCKTIMLILFWNTLGFTQNNSQLIPFPPAAFNYPVGMRLSCMQSTDMLENILVRHLVNIHTHDGFFFHTKRFDWQGSASFQGSHINKTSTSIFTRASNIQNMPSWHTYIYYLFSRSNFSSHSQIWLHPPFPLPPSLPTHPVRCHWDSVSVKQDCSEVAGILWFKAGLAMRKREWNWQMQRNGRKTVSLHFILFFLYYNHAHAVRS